MVLQPRSVYFSGRLDVKCFKVFCIIVWHGIIKQRPKKRLKTPKQNTTLEHTDLWKEQTPKLHNLKNWKARGTAAAWNHKPHRATPRLSQLTAGRNSRPALLSQSKLTLILYQRTQPHLTLLSKKHKTINKPKQNRTCLKCFCSCLDLCSQRD